MNDRFKFRVWNKENKKLYDWDFLEKTKEENTFFWVMHQAQNDCKHNILMQCTGLKDKNGKLIYEGDIVKHLKSNQQYKVQWDNKGFWQLDDYAMARSSKFLEENYEVIGNIYQNPELLED